MIKIGICDDDENVVNELSMFIEEYGQLKNIDFRSYFYFDGQTLLNSCSEEKFDILLLDIEVGKHSGIKIAQIINKNYPELIIMFITSYHSFVKDAFRLKVFQYLEKPIYKEVLFYELDRILLELNSKKDTYLVRYKGESWLLDSREIIYLESEGRYVLIHTLKKSYKTISKLGIEHEKLNKTKFIRIHKSTIVNINYIYKIEGNFLYLKTDNSKAVAISRSYKDNLSKLYFKYLVK